MPEVWFEGDCIKCGMCAEEAPTVFVFVENVGPEIRADADIASHGEDVKRAAEYCPTGCIKYKL